MGFLTASQTARIKAVRSRAWNRPFYLKQTIQAAITDFYDEETSDLPLLTLSGDWDWRSLQEHRGSAGGVVEESDILIGCSIDYLDLLTASGSRLIIEEVECMMTHISPYPGSGEIVIAAKRVL